MGYRFAKRAFDIVFSVLVIIILLIPGAILAILIAIDLRYKPFYTQKRVGRGGKRFTLVKFRTMVPTAEHIEQHLTPAQKEQWHRERKVDDDPRTTRFGRALRRLSLDELPQFFNVLFGQMSIVGPRPITEHELHWFGDDLDEFLSVPMGITGLWQVTARNDAHFADGTRQAIELDYVRRRGARLDARILWHTLGVMFGKRNG